MSKRLNTTTTREKFLAIAQEAFLRKSYREVSMRELSQISGVGLSNIYNYFKNKDEIFDMLVLPTVRYIEGLRKRHQEESSISWDFFLNDSYTEHAVREIKELIIRHKSALLLLFFKSKGSHYENYREEVVRKNSALGRLYITEMQKRYANVNIEISPIFVTVTCDMYVNIIENLLKIDHLTDEVIHNVISTYIQFISAGWERIMHIGHERKI